MKKILVTSDFCKGAKKLVNDNLTKELHELRTVLIILANGRPVPKKYHDHQLSDAKFRELHVSGDVLLLYRNDTDSDTLVVSLKLANITNHKKLNNDAFRSNYEYTEVSTQDLNDITSSICIDNEFDEEFLNDFLESISDYASMDLKHGYVLLQNYYIQDNNIHCQYDYISDVTGIVKESIDFIIDIDRFCKDNVYELKYYFSDFYNSVKSAFET